MLKHVLLSIVFFALPAFATISQRQSPVSQWNSSPQTTCYATLGSGYQSGDLIVVWTYWTSSSSLTASVGDQVTNNSYVSAVGPTLQSASSTPITAQIFYVANTRTHTGTDLVTVTFSGSASTSGCVFVEYQGADIYYPLDSVSAGYSTSGNQTSLLDSGTAAPANGNLLVFGGGTTDNGTASLIINSPFSVVQNHSGSITEQMIVSASMSLPQGNNTLQRAQASSTASGNWVMQMAVFRDASWTVAGGWNPVRITQVLDATQFPGSDIGAQINAAYGSSSCPSTGCHIRVPAQSSCYQYLSPISFAVNGKPVLLEGDPNGMSCIQYTGTTGSAVILDWGNNLLWGGGVRDLQIVGPGGSSSVNGLQLGPTNQLTAALVSGVTIYGFENCVNVAGGTNNVTFSKDIVGTGTGTCSTSFNFPALGQNFVVTNSAVSGAAYGFNLFSTGTYPTTGSAPGGDLHIKDSSCDAITTTCLYVGGQNGGVGMWPMYVAIFLENDHFENPSGTTTAQYITANVSSMYAGPRIHVVGGTMSDDAGGGTLTDFIDLAGADTLTVLATEFGSSGRTITSAANCHTTATWVYFAPSIMSSTISADLANCTNGSVADIQMRGVFPYWKLQNIPIIVGGPGTALAKYARYSVAESPATTPNGGCAAQTFNNVAGVGASDILIAVSKPTDQAHLIYAPGHVTGASTVTVNFCGIGAAVTPTAGETYQFVVVQ
jgi:hypothetical protein